MPKSDRITSPNPGHPQKELQNLLEGNRRYMDSQMVHPRQSRQDRARLVDGQTPWATILTCADSRVVPEIIFDQGLGDLFVLRVAGNVLNEMVVGSIEYAVDHLGTSLVMVLGHSDCGAVKAAAADGPAHGHIGSFTRAIEPALRDSKNHSGDIIDVTAKTNARQVADQLKQSEPLLAQMVSAGKLAVVPAFYRLDTGEVELF